MLLPLEKLCPLQYEMGTRMATMVENHSLEVEFQMLRLPAIQPDKHPF